MRKKSLVSQLKGHSLCFSYLDGSRRSRTDVHLEVAASIAIRRTPALTRASGSRVIAAALPLKTKFLICFSEVSPLSKNMN